MYEPAAPRRWSRPVGSGTVGVVLSLAAFAALAWVRLAAFGAPESYGL